MQVKKLWIKNLRSVRNLEISFENATALLGENNSGKSTILKALEIFFDAAPKLRPDDFYERNSEEVEVTVEFHNLTAAEIEEFTTAVIDGEMTIRRTFKHDGGDGHLQYSARKRAYEGFEAIRAEKNGTKKRSMFNQLAKEVDGLTAASNGAELEQNMMQYEEDHHEDLTFMFVRDFFGAPNVASGKLKKKTSLHLIPAVADATVETTQSKSPIIQLLSEISRQIYENKEEVSKFVTNINEEFDRLVSPEQFPQLNKISQNLTDSIQKYYKDSKLLADWEKQEAIAVNFPRPIIKIEDQGFSTQLENVGHGLQRAALFAIIQFLAERALESDGQEFDEAQSDIILLVEEPEIYQHPHKQELICDAFHKISESFSMSTGIRFQIIFTTHSEKFIGIDKFQSAHILRRTADGDVPSHFASCISISDCCEYFAGLVGKDPMSPEAFEAKLHIFSREVCEGFFAKKIILVEGVSDKAVLHGFYRYAGRNPIDDGISIIQMDGKTKIDKPFYIFHELGIPTYCVFDSDHSKKAGNQKTQTNILIQKIAGIAKPIDFPDGIFTRFSAFKFNLEKYLREAAGDVFDEIYKSVSDEYQLPLDEISKTPSAVAEVVKRCVENGISFERFEKIIDAVDAL